nr:hypothetical protein [Kutzneria buriramensis]WKX15677.1 hypothetical protein Q4V64_52540 [Kutzneria buriramensis]
MQELPKKKAAKKQPANKAAATKAATKRDVGASAAECLVQDAERRVGPALRAGLDAFGERAKVLVSLDHLRAFSCAPAVADMDIHRLPAGQPALDQSGRREGAGLDAALPLGFASLLVGDPPPGPGEVALLHPLQEAEHGESR